MSADYLSGMLSKDPTQASVLAAVIFDPECAIRAPHVPVNAWADRKAHVLYETAKEWAKSGEEGWGALLLRLSGKDNEFNWSKLITSFDSSFSRTGVAAEFDENINIIIGRAAVRDGNTLSSQAYRAATEGNFLEASKLSLLAADSYRRADPRGRTQLISADQVASALYDQVTSGETLVGPASGLDYFDVGYGKLTFAPQKLVIIAARPSVGKTAFMLQMLREFARETSACFWSCEMGPTELMVRMAASVSGVRNVCISTGKMTSLELQKLREALEKISELPIVFSDAPSATSATIAAMIDETESRFGACGVAMVDYIQRVKPIGKHANKNHEVGEVSSAFKEIARSRNTCMFVASQLNRGIEKRENRRPMMSDLKESGDIEQDADAIFFLDRPSMWNDGAPPRLATLFNAKFRNGRAFTRADLDFDGDSQVFTQEY